MDRWISVGIPCGKMDDSSFFQVIYNNQQFSIPEIGYRLWLFLFNGNTLENAYESLKIQTEDEKQLLEECISDFTKIGLIIPLQDAFKHVPLRQGTGMGLIEDAIYAIQCSKIIQVPFYCYYIWCFSDGKNTINDIQKIMKERDIQISNEMLIKAFYLLLQTEAIALT